MVSDEIDEEKASLLGGGAGWSSDRSSFRVIDRSKGRNPLAKLAGTGHRRHGTPRTDVGRADVGIKSPTKWTEKERRLPNAGNCQEEKAKWHPAEWKKGTESKDSITGKYMQDFL